MVNPQCQKFMLLLLLLCERECLDSFLGVV
jgi:hypothetical protein